MSIDRKRGFNHKALVNKCEVKDDLINQLTALNNNLNTLSPAWLHSQQARAVVQERRESLQAEIKRHSTKTKENLVLPPNAYAAVKISSDPPRKYLCVNCFPHSSQPTSRDLAHLG
jgi:hypothetical protein